MTRKRKSKKPTKARTRKLTLVAWSKAVRVRAKWQCEVCGMADGFINLRGNPVRLNAHHIEDRANQRLRFDLMNGIALCPTCHKFGLDSAHRSPLWFMRWLTRNLPDRYEYVSTYRHDEMTSAIMEVLKSRIQKVLL